MKWLDDVPDDWADAPDDPPVSAGDQTLSPVLLGVGLRDLETDCAEHL
jgi:hypothetical protein